jgi:hypothetical protein
MLTILAAPSYQFLRRGDARYHWARAASWMI